MLPLPSQISAAGDLESFCSSCQFMENDTNFPPGCCIHFVHVGCYFLCSRFRTR